MILLLLCLKKKARKSKVVTDTDTKGLLTGAKDKIIGILEMVNHPETLFFRLPHFLVKTFRAQILLYMNMQRESNTCHGCKTQLCIWMPYHVATPKIRIGFSQRNKVDYSSERSYPSSQPIFFQFLHGLLLFRINQHQ